MHGFPWQTLASTVIRVSNSSVDMTVKRYLIGLGLATPEEAESLIQPLASGSSARSLHNRYAGSCRRAWRDGRLCSLKELSRLVEWQRHSCIEKNCHLEPRTVVTSSIPLVSGTLSWKKARGNTYGESNRTHFRPVWRSRLIVKGLVSRPMRMMRRRRDDDWRLRSEGES
jgi:hypothetical protein